MQKLAIIFFLSVLAIGGGPEKTTSLADATSAGMVETSNGYRNAAPAAATRYVINTSQSRFVVRAYRGGLLWFLGHDHIFAVREFTGEAQVTAGSLTPASLLIRIKADSLAETQAKFTEQEKKMINEATHKQVLGADEYPEITFKSTDISAEKKGENQYEAKIGGDLTLHGVTRHVVIPAQVNFDGNTLHADGEFSIERSDYNVKTKSIKWGTIGMRDKVKLSFDIVANRN